MAYPYLDPDFIKRFRIGPLAQHLDAYVRLLEQQGYSKVSARAQLRVIARFTEWLSAEGRELRLLKEATIVRFTLPDVCHTFRSGHKLMIQVQSSWFPLVDRNPQTFVDIYKAKESDFKAATHRIYRTTDRPSSVKLSVVRGAAALRP